MVLLQNRYQYIPLSDRHLLAVTILHGAINPNSEPCLLVNAVLRHGFPHDRYYRAMTPPIPYELVDAKALLKKNRGSASIFSNNRNSAFSKNQKLTTSHF